MADLDNILSEARTSAPVSEQTPQTNEPAKQETTPQTPVPDKAPAQASQQPEADDVETFDVGGQKMVPHQALHAEKQKAKRYTEQVADFERKLAESQAEIRRFQQQQQALMERLIPQQQAQQPEPPDFFADPNAAAQHVAQQTVQRALQPFAQQMMQSTELMSRRFAVQEHGQESVNAAYQAIERGFQTGDRQAVAEYQRIMASGDPWGELVQWHKRAEITRDPIGWQERERERIRAEVLSENQPNGGQQQPVANGGAAPVMPSNFAAVRNVGSRSGPAWGGPSSIASIFAEKRGAG